MKKFINFFRTITYLDFILVVIFVTMFLCLSVNVSDMESATEYIVGITVFISGQLLLFIMQHKQSDDENKEQINRLIEANNEANKKMDKIIELLENKDISNDDQAN